jgi:Na+/melibiose symporter-like transporter
MKTILQNLIRRPLLLWTIIVAIFAIATWLRINSIDRGTPVIGVAVYLMMLMIFFTLIAVPAGMVSGALARWFLRWSIDPSRLRIATAIAVALTVFALHHLGRSGPPWHVWMSTAAITALFTLRTFRWGRLFVIAWYADRAAARVERERSALAFDLRHF